MGGSAKKVVGIAVAVAVPFVAPKIIGALAASAALKGTAIGAALATTSGAAVGGALVGAGLGAVGARVTGGDVGRGALMGAIGGGVASGAQASQFAQASRAAAGLNADAAFMAADAAQLAGQGLSPAQAANVMGGSQAAFDAAGLASQGLSTSAIQQNLVSSSMAPAGSVSAAATGTGAVAPTAQTGSFTQAMAEVPGEIAGRFSDPTVLADMTLRAAGSLLTGQMAGDGLTPQEQQLLEAQMADLQQLREQDVELFNTRVQEAMGLLGEARYFDPAQFGFQAQAAVQRAGAQQMREAERAAALTPGRGQMSASDRRRAGLDIAARGQTAFAQGAESGQKQRLATYQAGLAALPNAGPSAGLTHSKNLMAMYGEAENRRREAQRDAGDFFGDIMGVANARRTGDRKPASIG